MPERELILKEDAVICYNRDRLHYFQRQESTNIYMLMFKHYFNTLKSLAISLMIYNSSRVWERDYWTGF
jgi:hypothetical protein